MEQNLNNLLTAPPQRTLSDYVADQLRQAILVGQLKPNQRLVEEELAASMQTSRGPIRDALRMLENDGLVVRQSHRGAFVAELSTKDVMEIYTLREALESLAIKFTIQNATSDQIAELEQLVRTMEDLAKTDYNQLEATDLDIEFHRTLCHISGHQRVLAAWEGLSAQIRLVVLKHRLRQPGDFRNRAVHFHSSIIEAIRQRNLDKSLEELHKHMTISVEWIIQSISET